jgi:hypothetical protein
VTVEDLVRWLRAQLDEDERIARAAASVRGPDWWFEGYFKDMDGQVLAGRVHDGGSSAVRSLAMTTRSDAEGEHAARHDPARVLREIEAKREILARYEELRAASKEDGLIGDVTEEYQDFLLHVLALPYADRPGYQESWRP